MNHLAFIYAVGSIDAPEILTFPFLSLSPAGMRAGVRWEEKSRGEGRRE